MEESVWTNKKAQTKHRFLRGRQIVYMIYDNFGVTRAHDTVLDYAALFRITLRDDNVQKSIRDWMKFFYL